MYSSGVPSVEEAPKVCVCFRDITKRRSLSRKWCGSHPRELPLLPHFTLQHAHWFMKAALKAMKVDGIPPEKEQGRVEDVLAYINTQLTAFRNQLKDHVRVPCSRSISESYPT